VSKAIHTLLVVALIWLVVAALIVLQFWPELPRTTLQWVLLVAFGPPLYVIGEAFFGSLFSQARGHSISPRKFSFKRILFAIPVVLVFFAISWWLSSLLGGS